MSFSERNEELQERVESQWMSENWSAEEESIIYLQQVGSAICSGQIGFLHSWGTNDVFVI